MATEKALAGEGPKPARRRPLGWSRAFNLLNPLRAVWWLFTNVRFAMLLLALLPTVSLAGVLIPQVPLNIRGDAVQEADWLRLQHGHFRFLTAPMDKAGLFDLFHAQWFAVLLAMTVASTGAYLISRFPGIWSSITRPRKRVPDRYFEMAPNRLQVSESVDAGMLESILRRRRYRVDRLDEDGATYLFADRFQWAQFGTLLTHAAVIVFILSAVVSQMDSFQAPLFLSEGSTLPVFPVRNPQQIQVQLLDAVGTFSADGQPLDYRSELTIYRNGEEVMRCTSTVNSPCTYDGYRFHQVGYFGFGAAVQVRDLSSGNVIYSETLALSGRAPSPHVLIKDATGGTVLDQTVPLTEDLNAGDISYRGALVSLPDGRLLTVGLQDAGAAKQRLAVLEAGSAPQPIAMLLDEGQAAAAGGLQVTYVKQSMTPSAVVADMPLPPDAGGSATGQAQLQLSNVVYGTDKTSAGTTAGEVSGGPALLTLSGLSPQPLALRPGQSAQIGGYQYTFLGQREFAGIQVKRDRSDYVVWAGATLIVLGLMITFWVPRRRLWAKISSAGTQLAGQAASHARYTRELAALAREAGAGVSEETEDDA